MPTESSPKTGWSEERIRAMLETEEFPYQKIDLPYGLSTGGTDRSATADAIFPADMSGKTVLDIGCKYGYFCFEALKRGARRAVGVDVDPNSVRKARKLADCLGAEATFGLLDVETDPIEERFDYVLCLNLLHHLRNPIGVMDKLISVTRERLILEVATLGRKDRRKVKVAWPLAKLIERLPVVLIGRNGTTGRRSTQKFFITSSAIDNLLLYHRHIFSRVDTRASPGKRQRFLSIAHRRRIGRLVVIAGPTSAGKSTLQDRLMGGDAPEIAARVGVEDPRQWIATSAGKLPGLTESVTERLVFHYDFLRPYLASAQVHERDESLDVVTASKHVSFVTVWTPPERLRKQLHDSEIGPRTKFGRFRGKSRWKKIQQDYESAAKICDHYRRWFAYTRTKSDDHVVVELGDRVKMYSVDEWETAVARHGTAEAGAVVGEPSA